MVDIFFLGPVTAGTASGELGRSSRCGRGPAGGETDNGRGAGRDGKFARGGRGGGRRPRRGVGGQRRSESAARRPGPPPARADGSSRTAGTPRPASARPIYSPGAARRRGRAPGGRGLPADPPGSPGNAARRLADVRRLLALSLVAANFSPLGEEGGAGRRSVRALGRAAPLGAAGWRRREGPALLRLWGSNVGKHVHVL